MSNNENEPRRPLMEVLDDAIRNAVQSANFEDRIVNQKQYMVLQDVYETLSKLIGGEAGITLHPAFSAGYITIKVSDVQLSTTEVSTLRSALEKCTAMSVEPITNGNLEIGVTVPNVFDPLES